MNIKKLVIILAVIFLVNFSAVYFIFYYNPIYSFLDVSRNSNAQIAWSDNSAKIAFLVQGDNTSKMRVCDLIDSSFRDYPLPGEYFSHSTWEGIGFSPDATKIAIPGRKEAERFMFVLDLNNGAITDLEKVMDNPAIARMQTGHPSDPPLWLDNETLIYENSIPWTKNGIVFVNLRENKQEKYLERAARPSLSHSKKELAYISRSEKIEVLNLENLTTEVLLENIDGYAKYLYWSPDDDMIAFEYDAKPNKQIMFIRKNEELYENLSDSKHVAHPQWIDENNVVVTELKPSSFLGGQSFTYKGLYLYNLSTREYKKLTRRVQSPYFSISPDGKKLVSNMGRQGIFLLDIDRIFKPQLIDKIRNYLGVASY